MSGSMTRWFAAALCIAGMSGTARSESEVAMNDFACSMYRALATDQENLLFSPFSISTALAMTAEGARGDTARQMAEVFGLDAPTSGDDPLQQYDFSPLHERLGRLAGQLAPKPAPAALLKQLAALRAELARANATIGAATTYDRAYTELGNRAEQLADQINTLQRQIDPSEFRSANALWLERSFTLEAPYLASLARYYQADAAMPLDFRGNAEGSRKTINDWVSTQTKQRIQNLIAPGMVDEATRLVLTNAVYFLGEWLEPFAPGRTRNENFVLGDGTHGSVQLMRARKSDEVKYAAFRADGSMFPTPRQIEMDDRDDATRYPDAGFQIVELPYRGGALSMQVLLPMRADGLAAVEKLLDAANLARWSAALETREVDVALPKFTMDASFELSESLQQLGMHRAFVNPVDAVNGAQFDGISTSDDPRQRLFIGAVVHKAFVTVDEKGTEAAAATAATAVMMAAGAAMPIMVDFTPVFRADRPFIFLIRDRLSGAVLFLGRLQRPT